MSGKTEWFTLTWLQRLCVLYWMYHWRFKIIGNSIIFLFALMVIILCVSAD